MTRIAFCIALLLTGCGGGGNDQPVAGSKAQFSIGPQLRPCETTAANAPPCPASQ
jgi:hypothetical protein